ncbi:MAG: hypothetical protein ACFFD4_39630 [Candidatus Odinarchaeota archaeon]
MESRDKNLSILRGSHEGLSINSAIIDIFQPVLATSTFSEDWNFPSHTMTRSFIFTGMYNSDYQLTVQDEPDSDLQADRDNSTVLSNLMDTVLEKELARQANDPELDQERKKTARLCTVLETIVAELKEELATTKHGKQRIERLEREVRELKSDQLALTGEVTRLQQELADRDEKAREREERIEKLEQKVKNLSTPRMQRFKKKLHERLVDSLEEQESGERKQEG